MSRLALVFVHPTATADSIRSLDRPRLQLAALSHLRKRREPAIPLERQLEVPGRQGRANREHPARMRSDLPQGRAWSDSL